MSELKVELLAPAGSMEAFFGAIHAGADAVYLAGNKYGARAYADNFTEKELLFCIRYAHIWGRKVYLTINTLFKEWELQDLYNFLCPMYVAGLDACIIQDLGVFQYVKQYFPDMELHVSTQMTITGAFGAGFLKELGATRIVPARELSLTEIRHMRDATGLEIETFIHGAMCYCYSGQCLFSSILGGRSGNRGKCAQPCRLPYHVDVEGNKKEECYPLSLKDMCTLEHLDELIESGIDSFKIEGRMKKPEYAAGVTAVYRKYIDLKKRNPNKKLVIDKKDISLLMQLYIRSEIQDGYYYKHNGSDMVTLKNPAYSGSNEVIIDEIRDNYILNKPKKKVDIFVEIVSGNNAQITMICEDLSVTVEGDLVTAAQNQPISEENMVKQISKLGDTCFVADNIQTFTDGQSFYALKALNELRRLAVFELENKIIERNGLNHKRKTIVYDEHKYGNNVLKNKETYQYNQFNIQVSTFDQLKIVEEFVNCHMEKVGRVYIEGELVLKEDFSTNIAGDRVYIALPYCMRQKDEGKIEKLIAYARMHGYNGLLVRNIEEYAFLQSCNYEGLLVADAGLYVWNIYARRFWGERMDGLTCPYELNKKESSKLFQDASFEKVVYGRIPMMITANCISKTMGQCINMDGVAQAQIIDRYHKTFPVIQNCLYCYNIIYNSVPLSLHKDISGMDIACSKRLIFTVETPKETYEVLGFFDGLSEGKIMESPYSEFTTGHEKRGVE
ncbi:MAG: U32 family peptidase [Lachnospiraceae bacterium]|nr:U32 family peptidase [Lachnospiraceae bacterium]